MLKSLLTLAGWFSRGRRNLTDLAGDCLSSWKEGDEGIVVAVEATSRLGLRLQEMGVLPKARIRLLRSGSATVIQIEDGRFCVRREDADALRVQRTTPTLMSDRR